MRRWLELCLLVAVLLCGSAIFAQGVPEIRYDSAPDFLKLPAGLYLGEAAGVATNSKGEIYVFTRSGDTRLFEFDKNGNFVRELHPHLYAWLFAHAVRVDPEDNIWAIDEGSNMVIKMNPEGKIIMTLGRRPESAEGDTPGGWGYKPPVPGAPPPTAQPGAFNRPTDVAWDAAGNIFVSDGYGNSRVAKYDKNGRFIKSVGSRGTGPGQFNTPHTIAIDKNNNVYVGDRGNKRIQVFDDDLNFKTIWTGVGAPWAICLTSGPTQYLYSSDAAGPIYKLDMEGHVIGKFGTAGKQLKQFGWIHEMDCRGHNQLLVGELLNWRVQKLTLHPEGQAAGQ